MSVVAIVVGVLAVAAVIAYVQHQMRQKRIAALRAAAARMGFTFSSDDPGDVLGIPMSLFDRGDGRGVELFLTGEHGGRPMQLFDYWYYEESTDSKGRRSRTYYRFTCALMRIDAYVPHLRLGREGIISRIGNALGIDDIELEYEDFNREFRVKSDDQRFAFSLLDGQMMEWLLAASEFKELETSGAYVLVARGKLAPEAWPSLAAFCARLHEHIPKVVFTTYPAR